MEHVAYQPTKNQLAKWATPAPTMPTDEQFKATWKRQHHGVERGWGMGKYNWIVEHADDGIKFSYDYQYAMWQARVDAVRGLDMAEGEYSDAYLAGYEVGRANLEKFIREYGRENWAAFENLYKGL